MLVSVSEYMYDVCAVADQWGVKIGKFICLECLHIFYSTIGYCEERVQNLVFSKSDDITVFSNSTSEMNWYVEGKGLD